MSYTDEGSGPAILFLHALGRSAADWTNVTAALIPDFRCIALDFAGHGDSERTGKYTFADLAQSTLDLINTLGLTSFSIVAHSMGATVAWLLAPEVADQLDALVLEDTAVPTDRHIYPKVDAAPPEPVSYDWEVRRQVFAELNSPDPEWRRRVTGLDVPILLLAGREDHDDMTETVEMVNHCHIAVIPVGHWIHQDAPDEFVKAVRAFLIEHMSVR